MPRRFEDQLRYREANFKNRISAGCGVIESILHFLLIAKRDYTQTEWELKFHGEGKSSEDEWRVLPV